jgi:hypothetical protein
MDLKEQIKGELQKQKEEEFRQEIEKNKNLNEIFIYTAKNHKICQTYLDYYKANGVKFKERDITLYREVGVLTQSTMLPVIQVGEEYLVHGREFGNAKTSMGPIRILADPEYVSPPFEQRAIELIKNMTYGVNKAMQAYSRQLAPILKILNSLAEEPLENGAVKGNPDAIPTPKKIKKDNA